MPKNLSYVLAIFFLLAIFVRPIPIFGQDQSTSGQSGVTTQAATEDTSLGRLWWLLPIALLPVLYLYISRNADQDRSSRNKTEVAYHDIKKDEKET